MFYKIGKFYCIFVVLAFLLCRGCFLYSDEVETQDTEFPDGAPWFTGPLLSPSSATAKPGRVNIFPYLNTNITYGKYNKHWQIEDIPTFYQSVLIVPAKTGITNWLDIDVAPRYVSNWVKSSHDSNIGDLPIRIGIQLFRKGSNFHMPDVKLGLGVIAPLGKYERLNPSKLKTDVTGVGSWLPTATLSTSKFWQIKTFHYVSARCGARYTVGTPVHVEGYNAYGGTATTKGYVYPGNLLSVFGAFEYNFSRNWAVACDALYVHRNRTKFTGKVADDPAAVNNMRAPSGEAFSLAPALEYNWSKNMGLICGAWFTVKGRNSAAFANALISFTVFI